MVQTKQDILRLLEKNKKTVQAYGINRIGLFGSFIKDKQASQSDVDLIVEFQEGRKSYRDFIELATFLEKAFDRKIELLTPEALSPYIGEKIKKETEYVQIAD